MYVDCAEAAAGKRLCDVTGHGPHVMRHWSGPNTFVSGAFSHAACRNKTHSTALELSVSQLSSMYVRHNLDLEIFQKAEATRK